MRIVVVVAMLSLTACGSREPGAVAADVAAPAPATAEVAPSAANPAATTEPASATTGSMPDPLAATEPATPAPAFAPGDDVRVDLSAEAGKQVSLAISQSSDEGAHAYAAMLADITGEMLRTHPDACGRFLLPQSFGASSWEEIPAAHREKFRLMQRTTLWTARNAPVVAPTDAEAGPLFDAIHDRLANVHGADALAGVQGEQGAAQACRAWHLYYTGIAAEAPSVGGRVMRWLNAP